MVTEPYKGGATISVGTSSTDADPPRDLSVPRITVTVSAEDVRRSPPVMVRRRALDGTAATPWAEVNEKGVAVFEGPNGPVEEHVGAVVSIAQASVKRKRR